VCDLLGRVRARRIATFVPSGDPKPACEAIVAAATRLLADAPRATFLGVGVGAPGPVDASRRVNVTSINLGWSDVRFADILEQALALPTVVDHNVRAMALAEARFGRWRSAQSIAFVYVRTGIGAGVVIGGRAYRGGSHGVMELGHLPVSNKQRCACGQTGCLEAVASEPELERQILAAASSGRSPGIADALASGDSALPAFLAALAAGDPEATRIAMTFVDHMASALVSVVNLMNPAVIVAGGFLAHAAGGGLFDPLRAALSARVFPVLESTVQVESTSFGEDCGAIGAATVALDRFFYEPQLERASRSRRNGARVVVGP
jgi:predicted NBD/HSP70 family sugar kinase